MQDYDNYDDDFQDPNHHNNKSIQLPKINNKSIQHSKSKNLINNNLQYQQNNYDDDFQSPKHQPTQISIQKTPKSNQTSSNHNQSIQKPQKSNQSQSNNNKIQNPSCTNNDTLSKPRQNSNKKLSLSTLKNNNIQTQSKYLSYLNNQFSHSRQQILQLPTQKINRLNQKLRTYIKKVNDQLTELINQNMRKLKSNTVKLNNQKTLDDQIKVLSQQKKNGQIYLETVQKQYQNLNNKWQKVKNLQSGPLAEQQISQINLKIKEISKQINLLKFNVSQQGNKLTEDNNYGQKINELKNKLSKIKKDQQRNTQKFLKSQSRLDQLSAKTPQIDLQLQNLTKKAKSQNINVNAKASDKKLLQKFEELKKKIHTQKMHRDKTESLNQTKLNIVKRDNEIIKNQLAQIQKKFDQIDSQMTSIKQASVTLIEQAKYQDLQPYIQTHLDFIYKNIMEGKSNLNEKMQRKNSSKNVIQERSKQSIKKYSSVSNIRKYERSQSDIELKPNFQIHKKSLFDEKTNQKETIKLQNKQVSERIWKEQHVIKLQKQKPKQMNQSTGSKPFIIRRSQNVNTISEGSPKIHKFEAPSGTNDEKENQKSTLLAPKMKFKKSEHQDQQTQIEKKEAIISEKKSNQLKQVQKEEQPSNSKPSFKIKKAVKQKAQIPDEDDNEFTSGSNNKTEANYNSQKQTQMIDKIKEENDSSNQPSNKKGPNFKLFKKSTNQQKQFINQDYNIQQEIKQSERNRSPEIKKQGTSQKKEQIQEDLGINVGRRQAGRKIQRKNQDSYAV